METLHDRLFGLHDTIDCTCVDAYDGDTCKVKFHTPDRTLNDAVATIRLFAIDTPEIRGDEREAGLKARDYFRSRILNKNVKVRIERSGSDKYGRLIGIIYVDDYIPSREDAFRRSMNEEMIRMGYAINKYSKMSDFN